MEAFGSQFLALENLSDPDGFLMEKERQSIEKMRRALRSRFPQVHLYIQLVNLPEGTSPGVYGFWRLNTAPLGARESAKHRSWSVLLVMEPLAQRASVACGYRIGHLVRDDAWQAALESMRKPWNKGRMGAAIRAFLKEAGIQIDMLWTDYVMRPD